MLGLGLSTSLCLEYSSFCSGGTSFVSSFRSQLIGHLLSETCPPSSPIDSNPSPEITSLASTWLSAHEGQTQSFFFSKFVFCGHTFSRNDHSLREEPGACCVSLGAGLPSHQEHGQRHSLYLRLGPFQSSGSGATLEKSRKVSYAETSVVRYLYFDY